MKKLLLLLIIPFLSFGQESILTGDVDCSGEVNSEDASLILQFVTNVIDELPCQDNMTGLTPEQLEEMINMINEQLNISYSGGSSNYPIMISNISTENMNFGDALVYCYDLEEGGHNDWFLPNLEQLAYAVGGGCELPDERIDNNLWTTSKSHYGAGYIIVLNESGGMGHENGGNVAQQCRCVRFGEGETTEGSSGSSNSSESVSSILGSSEQPITMIGPMYLAEDFPEFNHLNDDGSSSSYTYGGWSLHYHHAIRFCGELNYNGFSDWSLPSLNQILHYLANNNSNYLGISNLSNLEADNYSIEFWSLTDTGDSDSGASPNHKSTFFIYNNNATMTNWDGSTIDVANKLNFIDSETIGSRRFCFCVR